MIFDSLKMSIFILGRHHFSGRNIAAPMIFSLSSE
jgi:hypothetical protein